MKLKDLSTLTIDEVLGNIRLQIDLQRPELARALERYYRFLITYGERKINNFISHFLPNAPLYEHGCDMKTHTEKLVAMLHEEFKYSLFLWMSTRLYEVQFLKYHTFVYGGHEMEFFFEDAEVAKSFYEKQFCLVSIN